MKIDNSLPNPVISPIAPVVRETAGAAPDAGSKVDSGGVLGALMRLDPKADPNAAQNPRAVKKQDLDEIVKKMNETVKIFNRALEFKVATSGRVVVKVVDTDTGDVIRQIPPETMVDMYDRMDKMLGLLVDRKV